MNKTYLYTPDKEKRVAATQKIVETYEKPYIIDGTALYQQLKRVPPATDLIIIDRVNSYFDCNFFGAILHGLTTIDPVGEAVHITPHWLVTSQYAPDVGADKYFVIIECKS